MCGQSSGEVRNKRGHLTGANLIWLDKITRTRCRHRRAEQHVHVRGYYTNPYTHALLSSSTAPSLAPSHLFLEQKHYNGTQDLSVETVKILTAQARPQAVETPAFVLAALTAGGGITGYARTGSVPSIVAGVLVGALVSALTCSPYIHIHMLEIQSMH